MRARVRHLQGICRSRKYRDRLQRVREENLDNERRAMSKWISEDGLTESVDEPEEVLSSGV